MLAYLDFQRRKRYHINKRGCCYEKFKSTCLAWFRLLLTSLFSAESFRVPSVWKL